MPPQPARKDLLRYSACALAVFAIAISGLSAHAAVKAKSDKRAGADYFTIAQIRYGGGGDWYEDKTAMYRLQARIEKEFGIPAATERKIVRLTDSGLYDYPMLYMTGHGNVVFSSEEASRLREYLDRGGFLWASDDYGMDESFRREMKKVYPDRDLVELPVSHDIFHCYYKMPGGLPKVHEHAGGAPRAYAIFDDERMTVFYDMNTDIGDGLEAPEIHKDPEIKREAAFRMALNIVFYAMSRK